MANESSAGCNYTVAGGELDSVYFSLYGVTLSGVVAVGLIGNLLNILVFSSSRVLSAPHIHLVSLALWDFSLLLSAFLQWGIWALWDGGAPRLQGRRAQLLRVAFVAGNISLTGCIWLTVALTVERLVVVRSGPVRPPSETRRVKVRLSLLSLAAVIFNLPRLFELDVIDCHPEAPLLRPAALRRDLRFFLPTRLAGAILVYVGPTLVLACLSVYISAAVNRSRPQLTGGPELRVTRTLLVVVVKSVCCHSLPSLIDTLEMVAAPQYDTADTEVVVVVSNLLVVLNSALNFFIYLSTGQRFRRVLAGLFCPSRRKRLRRQANRPKRIG